MTQALATTNGATAVVAVEQALIGGDLAKLKPEERLSYYKQVCESVGLNPLTKPFEYITLNNKLTLYARKDCTDQLRSLKGVSITIAARETVGDAYVVTARATTKDGRTDESIGAVSVANAKGDALCNAIMKAETKAKRRVTLSICGLGMLDETELETIPGTQQNRAVVALTARQEQVAELKRKAFASGLKSLEQWQEFVRVGLELEEYYENCLDHASDEQISRLFDRLEKGDDS